jgi:Concanavalin A-like lectin/glucanases superfamily
VELACTWGGYADTNVDFTEFFAGNHTVAVRFMLQFPNAYTGPMLAVNGGGSYVIGQGDFLGDTPGGQTKLVAKIGNGQLIYPLNLLAGTWHHLAVTRTGSTVRLYLDGQQVAGR